MQRLTGKQWRYIHDELLGSEVTREKLESLKSPEELHAFAGAYDLDHGVLPLRWVAEHACCDRGTAVMVFWMVDPARCQAFSTREECPEAERDRWDLLQHIMRRDALGGYPGTAIRYDPDEDGILEEPDHEPAWEIPEALLAQELGEDFPDYWEEFESCA